MFWMRAYALAGIRRRPAGSVLFLASERDTLPGLHGFVVALAQPPNALALTLNDAL